MIAPSKLQARKKYNKINKMKTRELQDTALSEENKNKKINLEKSRNESMPKNG